MSIAMLVSWAWREELADGGLPLDPDGKRSLGPLFEVLKDGGLAPLFELAFFTAFTVSLLARIQAPVVSWAACPQPGSTTVFAL